MTKLQKRDRIGPEGLPSQEILAIVKEMRDFEGSAKERRETFERKYPDFAKVYHHLFDMACETSFDMDKLVYMIEMRDKIRTRQMTTDQASKEVGQKFFDIYVKDKIDPNTKN